ncbi:MAG: ribosome small subunit-dependent GTPase A [Parachlamydiales bacterium]|nr:ribosome small subunit-dependent GTPase A [Parachlamydiales bacterium]
MSDFEKYLEEEERFLSKDKKRIKKQRKVLEKKDRSKFKKTNTQKENTKKPISKETLLKGRVVSILGEEILVNMENKNFICTLRGLLKKQKTRNKNVIAVGDIVYFSKKNEKTGTIENIEKRYSILSRYEELRKKQAIIAVNIDQVLITTSVVLPPLKPALIDRYIIASSKGNMQSVILINKIDLLKKDKKAEEEYQNFLKIYEELGYIILSLSCKDKTGLNSLKNLMKGKTSVFSGQSGTGKSTIINSILKTKLKTGAVIKKTYKGAHITSTASLVPIKEGGFCIDTPGIKSFGIWDLTFEDLKNHFSEIFGKYSKKCKYPDCKHINEPGCYVKTALEENTISKLRFDSYLALIKEIEEKKRTKYE